MAALATAELVRHLLGLPVVIMGLAFIAWAEPIARYYAVLNDALRLKWFARWYGSRFGTWNCRLSGVLILAIGVYQVIVGTG